MPNGDQVMPGELAEFYGLPLFRVRPTDKPVGQVFACFETGNRTNGLIQNACLEHREVEPGSVTPTCPVHGNAMSGIGHVYMVGDRRVRSGT